MQTQRNRVFVSAGEGKSVSLGGVGVNFKIDGTQTGGALSVVEHPVDPGRLVPPHVHHREDEYSFVLEGTIGARIGDEEITAGPGCYVLKPKDVPHTFWNATSEPARIIEMIAPAGFERFFQELGDLAVAMSDDFPRFAEARTELGRRYELDFVAAEWIPELKEKYGLKLLGE